MNKAEIIDFMNATHDCYLATVEGDKPHVRGIGIVRADEDGILIQTSIYKDMYKQLAANPNVELCFHNAKQGIQARVSGVLEAVDDRGLKDEVIVERPFLKSMVEKDGYGAIAVYRLKNGVAHVWTFKTNLDPKEYIQL
jgi:pyridoxamine 5'-phosphate oxidase